MTGEPLVPIQRNCECGRGLPFRFTLEGITALREAVDAARERHPETLDAQATLATFRCRKCGETIELTVEDLALA